MTIPTFVLRDVEQFHLLDLKNTFVNREVRAEATFLLPSPVIVLEVVYRRYNNPEAANKTFYAEYKLVHDIYKFELFAKPVSATVELANLDILVNFVELSPTQGTYGDERDIIFRKLLPKVKSYAVDNKYHAFWIYMQGLVDEGW